MNAKQISVVVEFLHALISNLASLHPTYSPPGNLQDISHGLGYEEPTLLLLLAKTRMSSAPPAFCPMFVGHN